MSIIYTRDEERANCLTHAAGIFIGIFAGFYFLTITSGICSRWGIGLYIFGVISSYTASTVYHACPQKSIWRERLRKFDHAAIYWHIAGSYSPITLIGMSENMFWGWLLFCVVWLCALTGTFISFHGLKEHSNLETCCFVAMGLIVLIAFKPVLCAIGWESMGWIIAEGVSFITGAVFYSFKNKPYMHTVFHGFVLLGSICHILAVMAFL